MYDTIGEVIESIRKSRNITQQELADLIEVNKITISKIENNHRQPSSKVVKSISKALNLPEAYFYVKTLKMEDIPENKRVLATSVLPQIQALFDSIVS